MCIIFTFYFLLFSKVTLTSDVKVLELTADHFENYTTKPDGTTVIMFYAPWCPHCQDAKPEVFKAAAKMAKINTKNIFAFFNCEEPKNTDICQHQNIEGYPTIKAFSPQNKVHSFNGVPNEESLIKFIEDPAAFANSPDSGSDQNQDNENVPDVRLNQTEYLTIDNFTSTLSKTKHALVFFYAPWCPHCQDSKAGVDKASEKLKSKDHAIFAVNCEDKDSKTLCTNHGIEGYPTFKYFHNGEVYAEYEDELTTEAYLLYLSKPPKEKVKEAPKEKISEDAKEEKPEDKVKDEKMEFVKYLTGDTFQKEINKPDYHTMVMFYTPWCSFCQASKPHFNSAAQSIADKYTNRVLTAINCDDKSNEKLCESEKINGFPTFIHFLNGKRVKVYEDVPLKVDKLIKYFSFSDKDEL